jgi:uncharacterized protein YidB (DUF937 family)
MFDEILQTVKEHLNNNPQVSSAIPADKQDAIHNEIAGHITNGLQQHTAWQTGSGGLLSSLEQQMAAGGTLTNAIEGGVVSSLASKFGLSPMITGAIAGALPGIIQKYMQKRIGQ